MAIVEIINNPVDTDELLERLCNYIYDDEKIDNKYCIGCRGLLNPYDAYDDMKIIESVFGKTNGRHAYHFMVSFDEGTELISDDAWAIAYELSSLFFPNHIVLYAVHTKQRCLHVHFCVHAVNLLGGSKLHIDFPMLYRLQEYSDFLERKYLRM